MILKPLRSLRGLVLAGALVSHAAVAAGPVGVPLPAGLVVGETYVLTLPLVEALIASGPIVLGAVANTREAALLAPSELLDSGLILSELDSLVRQFGFDDYRHWVRVLIAAHSAFTIADHDQVPQENIDLANANYAALAALFRAR